MYIINKVYKIIYYNLIKFKNLVIFLLLNFFFRLNIYIPFFDKYYLLLIYKIYNNNKSKKNSIDLAKFFILNQIHKINKIFFLSPIFNLSGDQKIKKIINNIFNESQKISQSLLNYEDSLIVNSGYFKRFGHLAAVYYFILAIKLNLIKEKKIIILGEIKNFNSSVLKMLLKNKEVKLSNDIDGRYKKIFNYNYGYTFTIDQINLTNNKSIDFIKFYYLVRQKWKEKFKDTKNFVNLDKETNKDGELFLKRFNIDLSKDWFVIIHIRDNKKENIFNIRNFDINKCIEAIKFITSQGGYVIRIGDKSMKPINGIDRVIDISNNIYQNNNILYLFSKCSFSIHTASGPIAASSFFDSPSLYINIQPMVEIITKENDFILPSILIQKGKVINYKNRLDNFGHITNNDVLTSKKVRIINNTSLEILDAVKEIYSFVFKKEFILSKNQKKVYNFYKIKGFYPLIVSSIIEKNYLDFFNEN